MTSSFSFDQNREWTFMDVNGSQMAVHFRSITIDQKVDQRVVPVTACC
jgi:hypothetical protein